MRTAKFVAASILAISLVGGAAPTAAVRAAETCDPPFRVPQKSFQRLGAPNAYVWVDDIESKGRRYAPFQVSVVVGRAFAPFTAQAGPIERGAFERHIKSAYGIARTNVTVSEASVKSGAHVFFMAGKQSFVLRVVSVDPSTGGTDAMFLKLCR